MTRRYGLHSLPREAITRTGFVTDRYFLILACRLFDHPLNRRRCAIDLAEISRLPIGPGAGNGNCALLLCQSIPAKTSLYFPWSALRALRLRSTRATLVLFMARRAAALRLGRPQTQTSRGPGRFQPCTPCTMRRAMHFSLAASLSFDLTSVYAPASDTKPATANSSGTKPRVLIFFVDLPSTGECRTQRCDSLRKTKRHSVRGTRTARTVCGQTLAASSSTAEVNKTVW
jgi:hypothetical protein